VFCYKNLQRILEETYEENVKKREKRTQVLE
jgi:hypothetical protein